MQNIEYEKKIGMAESWNGKKLMNVYMFNVVEGNFSPLQKSEIREFVIYRFLSNHHPSKIKNCYLTNSILCIRTNHI